MFARKLKIFLESPMKRFKESIDQRLTGRHLKCFDFVDEVKNKKVLDVGSSFGWFERMAIKANCAEIVGIEPDKKFFYQAKKEVPGAIFKIGSALRIPAKKNYFDKVVMFDVIEHLPKDKENKALLEVKRVLKTNGEFFLSTPKSFWLANFMDPAWYFGHRHYSLRKIEEIFKKSGLKIKKIEIKGGFFEAISIILLYIFKWIFKKEIPFKDYIEKKRKEEYFSKKDGFITIFVKAIKIK